jgi:hypothetical protein
VTLTKCSEIKHIILKLIVKVKETCPAYELEDAVTTESAYGSSRQQDINRQ